MALTLISTHTASGDASIDITSGIDSTYDSYEFHFVNMHPENTSGAGLRFQVNAAGGSGFNESIISTMFVASHSETDSGPDAQADLVYNSADQALGTDYPLLNFNTGGDNDQSASGVLTLYAPSSTTYVKHFTSVAVNSSHVPIAHNHYVAGYINTTSAIDEISFKFHADNIDAGTIKMFGVS
jgi:hypothetical protein